ELGAAWLAAETPDAVTVRPKLSEKEIEDLAAALTEQRNPRSENLEKMSVRELVELFVEEEKLVQDALRTATMELAKAIEMVTGSLRNGGRLFYVGTGSSGRIGVLDASEIPPTFGASPDLVQGVIAGGVTALYRSVEGAEDEESAGALAMRERGLKAGTATTAALNIMSTGAMVALGKVRGNLMIDLHTTNAKLRNRAVRVVADLAQCDYESARRQLEAADWNLRAVVEKL